MMKLVLMLKWLMNQPTIQTRKNGTFVCKKLYKGKMTPDRRLLMINLDNEQLSRS